VGVRQEKKDRVRRELGRAAVRLFLERGFDGATVEDVVGEAGVSRRTFFRYFPSKEAAFFADHDERLARFRALLAAREAEGTWVAVREGLLAIAVSYQEDRAAALAWRRVMRSHDALVAYDLRFDASPTPSPAPGCPVGRRASVPAR
jgi:AcrR family transcriptional regulator